MALRGDIKDRVQWLQSLFSPYIGKPLTVEFDKHKFEGLIIREVSNQAVTGFKLAPDKRKNLENKTYTPVLLKIVFEDDEDPEGKSMIFTDEDTTWAAITNGVRARVGRNVVSFRLV